MSRFNISAGEVAKYGGEIYDFKKIRTAQDIGMTAYEIFGQLFMADAKYTEEEKVRILDWFSAALEGRPIGELQTTNTLMPEFIGEKHYKTCKSNQIANG